MADGAPICSCEEYKREIARLTDSLQRISRLPLETIAPAIMMKHIAKETLKRKAPN